MLEIFLFFSLPLCFCQILQDSSAYVIPISNRYYAGVPQVDPSLQYQQGGVVLHSPINPVQQLPQQQVLGLQNQPILATYNAPTLSNLRQLNSPRYSNIQYTPAVAATFNQNNVPYTPRQGPRVSTAYGERRPTFQTANYPALAQNNVASTNQQYLKTPPTSHFANLKPNYENLPAQRYQTSYPISDAPTSNNFQVQRPDVSFSNGQKLKENNYQKQSPQVPISYSPGSSLSNYPLQNHQSSSSSANVVPQKNVPSQFPQGSNARVSEDPVISKLLESQPEATDTQPGLPDFIKSKHFSFPEASLGFSDPFFSDTGVSSFFSPTKSNTSPSKTIGFLNSDTSFSPSRVSNLPASKLVITPRRTKDIPKPIQTATPRPRDCNCSTKLPKIIKLHLPVVLPQKDKPSYIINTPVTPKTNPTTYPKVILKNSNKFTTPTLSRYTTKPPITPSKLPSHFSRRSLYQPNCVNTTKETPTGSCSCGIKFGRRIVGGFKAEKGSHPWIAGIFVKGNSNPYCGGTIISRSWILTAAHCFMAQKSESNLIVRIGDYTIKEKEFSEKEVEIEKIHSHKNFVVRTGANDIALLKLKKPLQFSMQVAPACLPYVFENCSWVNNNITVIGWGRLKETGAPAGVLMQNILPVIPRKRCKARYSKLSSGTFCAYEKDKDTCQGDSGGPAVFHKFGRYYVIGVVSWGIGCARHGNPGIYTEVQKYIPWIHDITGENFCRM